MTNMAIDSSEKPVISITKDNLEEAIEVLTRAFEDDPVVRYFLSGHEKDYPEGERKLFRYQCLMYIEMGLPIFGTVQNNHFTGVACLSGPEKKDRPDSLVKADKEFVSYIGPDSLGRIKRYMDLSKKHTPIEPHHYLAGLGVHTDFQRQGFGRLLLDEVCKIAESHQTSMGIYLETAKMKNVEMYQYFGYNLLAEEKLDDIVDLWYMFRPVKKND